MSPRRLEPGTSGVPTQRAHHWTTASHTQQDRKNCSTYLATGRKPARMNVKSLARTKSYLIEPIRNQHIELVDADRSLGSVRESTHRTCFREIETSNPRCFVPFLRNRDIELAVFCSISEKSRHRTCLFLNTEQLCKGRDGSTWCLMPSMTLRDRCGVHQKGFGALSTLYVSGTALKRRLITIRGFFPH